MTCMHGINHNFSMAGRQKQGMPGEEKQDTPSEEKQDTPSEEKQDTPDEEKQGVQDALFTFKRHYKYLHKRGVENRSHPSYCTDSFLWTIAFFIN